MCTFSVMWRLASGLSPFVELASISLVASFLSLPYIVIVSRLQCVKICAKCRKIIHPPRVYLCFSSEFCFTIICFLSNFYFFFVCKFLPNFSFPNFYTSPFKLYFLFILWKKNSMSFFITKVVNLEIIYRRFFWGEEVRVKYEIS